MASGGSGRRGRREHRHGHHASRGGHRGAVMHVAPVVLATVLLCGVGVASAGDVSLLVSPGPAGGDASLWVAPRHFNHTLLGPVRTPAHGLVGPSPKAAAAGSAAHWMAAQWNSPSPLPLEASPSAARQCTGGGDGRKVAWAVADAAHRLCYYTPAEAGGARAVELAQAGAQVPCGEEFDFFLSPVSPIYHNALSSVGIAASPPLSHLAALRLSFGATWREAAVTARCGTPPQCGGSGAVDYGYTVAGVVFNNEAAKQTLFWQMYLGDTRNASECPHGGRDPCASNVRAWRRRSRLSRARRRRSHAPPPASLVLPHRPQLWRVRLRGELPER